MENEEFVSNVLNKYEQKKFKKKENGFQMVFLEILVKGGKKLKKV